jgi:hypothetical protein
MRLGTYIQKTNAIAEALRHSTYLPMARLGGGMR